MSRFRDAFTVLPFIVSGCIVSGFAAYGAASIGADSVERARAAADSAICDVRQEWQCTVCDADADYCDALNAPDTLPQDHPCWSEEYQRVLPGLVGDD